MTAALLLAALAGLAADGPASGAPELALIHVESNVGKASGGHSALRVGGCVYHYQRTPDGLLLLVREDWIGFRHVYAGLQNRSLHLAYLDLDARGAQAVAERFSRAYIDQLRELERRRRLCTDRDWWAALRDGAALPALRGAGLLAGSGAPTADGLHLRARLESELGAGCLERSLARVEEELASGRLVAGDTDLERARELLLEREVLRALDAGRGLDAQAVVDDFDPSPLLDAERRTLEGFVEDRCRAVASLLGSARPDRGFALAVAAARFHAARASLAADRLIVLALLPDDAPRVRVQDRRQRDDWGRVGERALAVSRELRAEVLDGGALLETHLNLLEQAASRGREARLAARGETVRLLGGHQLPSRGRSLPLDLRPDDVAARAARAERLAREAEQELLARHDYALLERNCVTELLHTLNSAFGGESAAAQALGRRLEPGEGLTFIPWIAHAQVTGGLRIARQETVASHRRLELARLERSEPGLGTALRERFVPLSTLYRPRPEDGSFLCFTDDAGALRPVLGVLNLGSGLLTGASGLLSLPFDGGERLESGLHGAFYSLPELVFGNVRKGSYGFLDGGTRAAP